MKNVTAYIAGIDMAIQAAALCGSHGCEMQCQCLQCNML